MKRIFFFFLSSVVIATTIHVNIVHGATKKIIDVPLISQLPELPRGCEVTSLAMMLHYAGIHVDKMTLAKKVKKDPTPFNTINGTVYFGNPYDGFVGNMYNKKRPGLGVYHGPIRELAKQYLGERVVDLTGQSFERIPEYIDKGVPVWVIANTKFRHLPPSSFRTWLTPSGKIKITFSEHSVLVTGYDDQYIYFNDPLSNQQNRKVRKASFKAAWEQMGKQAITYIP